MTAATVVVAMAGSRSRSTRSTAWSSWRSAAPRDRGAAAGSAIDCSLRTRVPGYFTPCGQDLTLDPQSCWRHEPDRALEDLDPTPSRPPRPCARRLLQLAERATTPLLPADYLDLFDPLRPGADLRGRIVAVHPETADAATIVIRPGADWAGHVPGQYVRIGVDVDGVRQWRAYSLTHGPRADGHISITVKAVPDGMVSTHLVRESRPGTLVHLEQAPGEFVLPTDGGKLLVRDRRLRRHPGDRDAPQPLPGRRLRASCACRAARGYDIVVVHVAPSEPRLDLPRQPPRARRGRR